MPPAKSLAISVLAIMILLSLVPVTTWAEDEQAVSLIVLKNGQTIQAGRAWLNNLGRVCYMKDGAVLSKAVDDVDLEGSRLVAPEKSNDADMSLAHLQAARIQSGPSADAGRLGRSGAPGGLKVVSASNIPEAQRQIIEKEKQRLQKEIEELKKKIGNSRDSSVGQMIYEKRLEKREQNLALLEYDPNAYFRKLAQPEQQQVTTGISTIESPSRKSPNFPKSQPDKHFTHSITATPAGGYNPWTGESLMKAGSGFVGTQDGTFYAPSGPSGIINTKTGEFIPVHR